MSAGAGVAWKPDETWSRSVVIVLVLGAIGYVGWTVEQDLAAARLSRDSVHWPVVTGTIYRATVRHKEGGRSHAACTWPEICFRYAVAGQSLTSCRATFEGICDRPSAQQLVAKHPVESEARVFYDPVDPTSAVLEPGTWNDFWEIWFGIVIVALALAFGVAYGLRPTPTGGGPRRPPAPPTSRG
jgi:hypothetical protein